ncbi:MAG TPA: hypothetical protein DD491_11665, partial [Halieaceae bacterium]|nr:hypothetical protein [Halieaceae bacterium]
MTTSGTITGSGSIFVNGQRFAIDDAAITVNGEPANEAALALGMVVTVAGSIGDDDGDGTARTVKAFTALRGIAADLKRDDDGNSLQLRLLGTDVIVEREGTVFAGTDFDSLAPGSRLAIDGFTGVDGRLRATRIMAAAGVAAALLAGTISALNGTTFLLDEQPVDAAGAVLEGLPADLKDGLRVQVRGNLEGEVLRAVRVSGGTGPTEALDDGDALRLEGRVARLDVDTFLLGGIRILAAGAERMPADLDLAEGLVVEATGHWNGEALVADTLTNRRGTLRLAATLSAIDNEAGTLALQLPTDSIALATDRRTLVEDARDGLPFPSIEDLRTGDYVKVEALRDGDRLLVTRIDRGADTPARVLQAPVEDFTAPATITLLGLSVAVDEARFQNAVDTDIDRGAFFDSLSRGALVRTVDEDGDGRAEVVEFEFPRALDGELAFRDEISVPLVGDKALPANILTDLTSRFAAQDIAGAWLDEDEYEVALADGTRLFYTADGALLDSSGPSAEAGHVTSDGGSIPPGQGGDIPGSPGDNPGSGGDIPGSPGDDPGSSGDAPGSSGDNPGSS